MKVCNMTEGRPLKLILTVALPLMVGNIFQQLYTVMDAQIVGMVEGVNALAALGAVDWFNWMFLAMVQGFAQGFTIPVAQAFGGENYGYLRKNIGNGLFLSVVLSVFILIAAQILVVPVLHLLDTPQEVFPIAKGYIRVLFAGLPVVMAYNFMSGILRALGNGRIPLYAMITAAAVNIGLDLLFVAVFRWGVSSAAVATVIAQCVSCVFCFVALRRIDFIKPSREEMKINPELCRGLVGMGLPLALQNLTIAIGGMVIQSIVNTCGITFIAGYTATNKLYGTLEIAAVSYGFGVSSFVGQNLGAGRTDRIRKGVHAGAITGAITAWVIMAAMLIFGRTIVSGFISGTPEEVAAATKYSCEFLYIMSVCLPILYLLHIYRSALQGMGNALVPMSTGILELLVRVGSAFVLPGIFGYKGLFYVEILAWISADVVLLPGFYIFLKRKKTVLEESARKVGSGETV